MLRAKQVSGSGGVGGAVIVFAGAYELHLGGVGQIAVAGISEVGGAAAVEILLDAEHVGAIVQVLLMHALVFVQRGFIFLVVFVKFPLLRLRHRLGLHLAVRVVPRRREHAQCAESNQVSRRYREFPFHELSHFPAHSDREVCVDCDCQREFDCFRPRQHYRVGVVVQRYEALVEIGDQAAIFVYQQLAAIALPGNI